MGVAKFIPRNC